MANYLTTDTDLTAVANAIRTKGGTSAQLAFPADFVQAIADIPTGGGGYTLLASGSYTLASDTSSAATIPVNAGVPAKVVLVHKDAQTSGVAQGLSWIRFYDPNVQEINDAFPGNIQNFYTVAANGTSYYLWGARSGTGAVLWVDDKTAVGSITIAVYNSSYPTRAGTYTWYVYG